MSKFKFKSIKSYSKVLRSVKRDLWGSIILTNNNKFKRIYSKLYSKRRRIISRIFRFNYIKNFLIISKGRLINTKFFGAYLVKKARKKRVKRYKKILNKKFHNFDVAFNAEAKVTDEVTTLTGKVLLISPPTLQQQQQRKILVTKLVSKSKQLKVAKLIRRVTKKQVAEILTRLKRSFYFKKLQNRKKKLSKKRKKSVANLKSTAAEYVTEQQQMIYMVEMLKLKKKNFRLHIKVTKQKIINKLKKKKFSC